MQHLIDALLGWACGRSTKGVLWMVRKAVRILRERFPEIKVTLGGDCGFGDGRLINWCERAGAGYVLAVQATNPMREKALRAH